MSEHPLALRQANLFAPDHQVRFLEALALWGNARSACRMASVSHQTVYRHRRNSADFRLAWDAALVVAKPQVEEVLGDRALNGIEEVIYYHGEEIGRRHRYDGRLLLAHLARLDRVEEREEVAEVAGDFDAALERLRRGEPVDPLCTEDDEDEWDRAGPDSDEPAWMDESLPFVDRVLLYLDEVEAEEAAEAERAGPGEGAGEGGVGGGGEEADDALPDPFGPVDEADDDYEYEADEDFDASRYILRDNPPLDPVTPVTLQQPDPAPMAAEPAAVDPEPERQAERGPEPGPDPVRAPEPEPEPVKVLRPYDQSHARRLWGSFGPIDDGRLLRC
jgi:hypothetical protein